METAFVKYPRNQETFDRVYAHLVAQGERSYDVDDASCMYRGPDNTSCAVGCLIPDELYKPEFEHRRIGGLFQDFPDLFEKLFEGVDVDLLTRMQHAHDMDYWGENLSALHAEMKFIAENFGLNYTQPQ